MDKVKQRAETMAMERVAIGMKHSKWKFGIRDNPYRWHTKNSVIWHNAFYDKCREIGRDI